MQEKGKKKKKKTLKSRKKTTKRGRTLKGKGDDEPILAVTVITLDEGAPSGRDIDLSKVNGLADALMMSNSESIVAELSNQDVEAVDELDKELREESINVSRHQSVFCFF